MKRGIDKYDAFLALLGAGLWEKDIMLSHYEPIDYDEIRQIAQEQSVVGIVAAGIEHVSDVKIPKEVSLFFVGEVLQLEQRNLAMNEFVGSLIDKLRKNDVYVILVKGQGIAQCYESPHWRASGDVDLLLSENNYIKAKKFLLPLASFFEPEIKYSQHIGMIIDKWEVELHGNLHTGILRKVDRILDEVQNDIFYCGNVRSWMNKGTQIFLPGVNDDVIFVFAHILQHFFKGGVGLRQICDWCRLIWKYKDIIDIKQLESRLRLMGVISEWRAFASLAVDYLGMPTDSIPLYSNKNRYKRKANRIMAFIFKVGNMGHNRDIIYFTKYPYFVRKCISMGRIVGDMMNYAKIFPLDSLRFFPRIMFNGIRSAMRGE